MIRPLAVFIASLIIIGTEVHAASFDCARARRGYEALICANEELLTADDVVSEAYRKAQAALSLRGSGKEVKKERQRLQKEQQGWLKTRLFQVPQCGLPPNGISTASCHVTVLCPRHWCGAVFWCNSTCGSSRSAISFFWSGNRHKSTCRSSRSATRPFHSGPSSCNHC